MPDICVYPQGNAAHQGEGSRKSRVTSADIHIDRSEIFGKDHVSYNIFS